MSSIETDKEKCDKTWKNLSDNEWEQLYNKSIEIWNNLKGVSKETNCDLELDKCPMHPNRFFEFSSVIGFNKNNGWSYNEYISNWWERRGKKYGVPKQMM